MQLLLAYKDVDIFTIDREGRNILHYDSIKTIVQSLFQILPLFNTPVNSLDNQGFTLHDQVCSGGDTEIVQYVLIHKGIEITHLAKYGRTALDLLELLILLCSEYTKAVDTLCCL